jgi:hypothetical protein
MNYIVSRPTLLQFPVYDGDVLREPLELPTQHVPKLPLRRM